MGKKKRVHRLIAPETRPIPAEDLMGPPNKKKKIRKQIEKRAKRAAKEEAKALARAPRIQRSAQPLNAPDHVVASLWGGPGSVDEATKLRRKALGVVVRGAAAQCPAPLEDDVKWGDARLPQPLWRRAGAKLNDQPFTAVQRQAWPAALAGLDVLAVAPTGSGKTLAYVLPAVARLRRESSVAVALAPTRELAKQVLAAVKRALRGGTETAILVAGGAGASSRPEQADALRSAHFVVATPGRLADLASSNLAPRLNDASILILDEADRMLQLGFEEQLDSMAASVPGKRQTLLFTATFPGKLRDAAARWVRSLTVTVRVNASKGAAELEASSSAPAPAPPVAAEAADDAAEPPPPPPTTLARVPPNVVQRVHVCAPHKRPRLLLRFLERVKANATGRQQERVLIFANTAQACGEVAELIRRHDGKAVELHGKLRQSDRDKHLLAFKAGKTPVLCATDVAGRGLHVPGLKVVVNWDFPPSLETYTHRVGRAGRGGEAAEALSLFTRNFAPLAPALVALLEGSSQAVDPQLRECATKREARVAARSANDDAEEEEEGEDLFLAAMRAAGVVE
jgi:ATP-dependent RNA helicase DDX5/DBP2